MKSFVEAQFWCCPLNWMLNGRKLNRKINHIHERFLCIVYRDYNSSFNDLLKKDKFVCIHHRNIKSLVVELFKMKESLSNRIMKDIIKVEFNIRNRFFQKYTVNTTKSDVNSLWNFASKVWNMIRIEIKISSNVEMFKNKLS